MSSSDYHNQTLYMPDWMVEQIRAAWCQPAEYINCTVTLNKSMDPEDLYRME